MRRGEVWWAELGKPIGKRPVLLLSRNAAYRVRTSITVAVLTTKIRAIPVEVPLGPNDGVPKECVVNLDSILTIPKHRLTDKLAVLSPEKMQAVGKAIAFALDLK